MTINSLFTGTGGLTHAQSAISNQQSAISNQQSAISNQQSAISNQQSSNHSSRRIIRPIISFITLATLFFVLPVSCDDPNTNGGSTDGGGGGGAPTDSVDVDADDDGLIDIRNLDMFDNIRLNLAGTSYNGVTTGGPTSATTNCPTDPDGDRVFLCGYELMENLDFAEESSYASGSENWTNKTWRPVDSTSTVVAPNDAVNAGFPGIGADSGDDGGFNAIFEGNGKTISNFYSRNAGYIGLFRSTDSTAQIRSLGVRNGNVYGSAGNEDNVGVLVGLNRGDIIASSAFASDTGTSSANGGDGNSDQVGGLVGRNESGITASYATGSADGGIGNVDQVGGLVGNNAGIITASYATGSANGGIGNVDQVGGLVGNNAANSAAITASYAAIGNINGGGAAGNNVGGLVGLNDDGAGNVGTITESYGFSTMITGGTANMVGGAPAGVTAANLTAVDASPSMSNWWNAASSTGAGAWNFGTAIENPALVYSDYDGTAGNTYPSCSAANGLFLTIPGTTTQIVCGETLIGGDSAQGR